MKILSRFIAKAFFFLALLLLVSGTAYASANPNLTPYKPSSWSDKIVVSTGTGTNSDSSPLYSTDTLYIDWAVLNNDASITNTTFYITLYVDNVVAGVWYTNSLPKNSYVYVQDFSAGSLSPGTHAIKIVADSTSAIAESNETDNEYTKTITVTAIPNLTPYKPAGWSDKIVVSSSTGTNTDSGPPYHATDTFYVGWSVINNGGAATSSSFTTKLYIDGTEKALWSSPSSLNPGSTAAVTDYSIGTLGAGSHDIKIVTDTANVVSESNETDNEYTKTILITDSDSPNLALYKPAGWSDKLVVTSSPGIYSDSGALYTTDTIYINWSVINNGLQPTSTEFTTKLFVDGIERNSWTTQAPLAAGEHVNISDYSLGTLSVGSHTVKIITDAGGAIAESDESDNAYTKQITILRPGAAVKKALVLLVDFSDQEGQESRDYFQDMMFAHLPSAAPSGSFLDYYLEVSYGKLQVIGTVNNTDIAWIRLPQTMAYYANGIDNGTGAYPRNAQKMVEDAVIAAAALGLDFGPYDTDNNGFVDSLFVIHAGQGAEFTGAPGDIWSHAWQTTYNVNTGSTNSLGNTVYARAYSTEPEYWETLHDMTIGVYAHEYGHILGLPDLYDTDYSSEGVGRWSLMAAGSWNGTSGLGNIPAHMDAWSKYRLGWVSPSKVTGTLTSEAIDHAETNADIYQLLDGVPGVSGEYFLVENRQKTAFDAALPQSGLLIWHIDEAKSNNTKECYPGGPSCVTGHYKVALVQADNLWELEKNVDSGDTGDPFPGSTNNRTFNASSSPNSNLYSGSTSSVSVTGISDSGSSMTATLTVGNPVSVQLSAATYSVEEGAGSVTITATRTGGSSGAVGVNFATGNATATAGIDYTEVIGLLSWANGDTADKTFSVPITNDALNEPDETFSVTLSSPTGGATLGSPSSATVTINDNDPQPTVQFQTASSGGSETITPAVITVTLSAASWQTVTVNYATADGTASAGSDYTSTSGILTFTAGEINKTINVPITYDLTAEGNETFTVALSGADKATLGVIITHTYTIIEPGISVSPALNDFGNVLLGNSSAPQAFVVSNTGNVALTINSITIGGVNYLQFLQTNNCGSSLTAGASCTVNVTFKPTWYNPVPMSAVLYVNVASPGVSKTIALSGTVDVVNYLLTPSSLSFSSPLNVETVAKKVTMSNTGTLPIAISGITIGGANYSHFTQTNNCGSNLPVGASCDINITFKPKWLNALPMNAKLNVTVTAPAVSRQVSLTGIIDSPALAFTAQLYYQSSPQAVTISNTGNAAVTINSITIAGANYLQFAQTNNCGSSLAVGESCTIKVKFNPTWYNPAPMSASLFITLASPASSREIALNGTVDVYNFTTTPSVLSFHSSLNVQTAEQAVSVSNTGNMPLTINGITIGGANYLQFAQTNNCGGGLAVGSSCTINVTFKPTWANPSPMGASLYVNVASPSSAKLVVLSGTID